jgi:hypothetical protein
MSYPLFPLNFPLNVLGGTDDSYWNSLAQAQNSAALQSYYQALLGASNSITTLAQAGQLAPLPPPVPPLEKAGISAGEIVAHRAWRIVPIGLLSSVACAKVWPPDEPMRGEGVDDYNAAGVHAFKSQCDALSEYACTGEPMVFGTVMLWGVVIEHERGYRAEYAKVRSIDLISGVSWWRERRLIRRIRQRYAPT